MTALKAGTRGHVAGFVRNVKNNRDGTTSFAVAGRGFRVMLLLPPNDPRVGVVMNDTRVLVCFTHTDKKYPHVERIITDPEGKQLQRVNEWIAGGGLPV